MTTASDICRALAAKYAKPEWCLAFEVSNSTGTNIRRYADAVAMSIWPSRGFAVHGFEVKVSRSDFMAEMSDPTKADAIAQYCDHWWLVTPAKLVDPAEVPPTWGLMTLNGSGLRVQRQAPRTEAKQMDRGFVAALLRRADDMQQPHIRKQIEEGRDRLEKDYQRRVESETRNIREEMEKLKAWVRDFEAAYGEKPRRYTDPKRMAASLKLAERLVNEYGSGSLASIRRSCEMLMEDIDAFDLPAEEAAQ